MVILWQLFCDSLSLIFIYTEPKQISLQAPMEEKRTAEAVLR